MNYSDLPFYEKYEVLVTLPHEKFKLFCMADKETAGVCSGTSTPEILNAHGSNITERLYEQRIKNIFSSSFLRYREEGITWREFYNRLTKFYDNLGKSQNHAFYAKQLIRQGKLMELKILNAITNILPNGVGIANMVASASVTNKIAILEWLKSKGIVENDIGSAISLGDYPLVKWYIDEGYTPEPLHIGWAVDHSNYALLDLFASMNLLPDQWGANLASSLQMINWLQQHGAPLPDADSVFDNLRKGNIEVLEWLHTQGEKFNGTQTEYLLNTFYPLNVEKTIATLNWLKSKGVLPKANFYFSYIPTEIRDWLRANNVLKE